MKQVPFYELLKEATVHFARSGGKGGQNVNKVETKVELIFNIPQSTALDDETKELLMHTLHNKIDHEGNLHITSSAERYQHANRKKAEQKFFKLIEEALRPQKQRIATAPSRTAKVARLYSKHKQSVKKKERRRVFSDE